MLITIGYFILALLLLVLVHEYGHFIVARMCGVKVLRFSFGFGKVLAKWKAKQGTEYVWSLLPLGGYVKLLDAEEVKVPAAERHLAFNNKPIWARIAIVIAGPLFNFIFAILAFWLVLVIGISSLAPIISKVEPNSLAAKIGLQPNEEIISFDNKEIRSWRDFQFAMVPYIGSTAKVNFRVKSLANGRTKDLTLPFEFWKVDSNAANLFTNLGIKAFIPQMPAVVGEILANSPAEKAALEPLDVILKVNSLPIKDWFELVDYSKKHPNESIRLTIKRNGQFKILNLKIASRSNQGFMGIKSQEPVWPKIWSRVHRLDPFTALKTSLLQTYELTLATFNLMGRFVSGSLPLQSVSGPIGIAEGAGTSGRAGLTNYLSFLAIISISLGALNLLPIPMLDGGYLLYYLIELIIRRPLSPAVKVWGQFIGMFFLITIMLIAFSNDITRLLVDK